MRTFRSASVFVILSTLALTSVCFAAAPDRINSAITAATVRLSHGVPLEAQSKYDQGPVSPSLQLPYITLLTVPSAAQQKALNQLLADQQNPQSASYHKWLTPEEYADQFGLSSNDISKLTAWLKSQGFTIVRTARGRNWIVFSGSAAQVQRTFHTQIHNFKVGDEMHFSNVTPPSIPSALSGIVTGFRGFSNFRPKSQAKRAAYPNYTFTSGGNTYAFIAPGDIATIYDVKPLYTATPPIDGTGQSVAVMGQTGIYQSDLTNFRQNFGLSAISCTASSDVITACNTSNFGYVLVNGSATNIYGDLTEADIDLEWSGATARGAQIIFVTSTDPSGNGVWDSWYYAVDNKTAPVITMSYTVVGGELGEAGNTGTGEFTYSSDEAELAKANSEGITFMNSSGDSGAAAGDDGSNIAVNGYSVNYPSSSVYVTAVGGTLIPAIEPDEYSSTYFGSTNGTDGGSALSYIPEQPWNDAQEFGLECSQASPPSFCTNNGITDWATAQSVIGISAGGGGVSNCVTIDANGVCTAGFPQPSWQSSLSLSAINPTGAGQASSTPTRLVPDVSLLASANFPGYLICTQINGPSGGGSSCDSPTTGITDMLTACFAGTGPCTIYGGTSVSAPIFAGMVALLNQDVVSNGGTAGFGNINPTLYTTAANASASAFHAVTSSTGANSDGAWCTPGTPTSGVTGDPWPAAMQCPSSGANAGFLGFSDNNFDPTTNYSLTVGLGSPDLNNLATAVVATLSGDFNITTSGTTTQTVLAGQTTPVYTFTVNPASGTTFGKAVNFSCSFSPTDPTLTNSSCVFTDTTTSTTGIPAGATGTQTITMALVTVGPNPNPSARKGQHRRADNRLPWLPLTLPIAGVVVAGFAGRKMSKYSMVGSLCLALVMAGLLIACGSSSHPISVTGVTATPSSLFPNDTADAWPSQTSNISVTITNDSQNKGVTWTAGLGTIVSTGTNTATYTAPQIVAGLPASDTITATSVADSTKSASGSIALTPATVPGTYTVTVTGTEGTNTHTQQVTLTVQ